LHLPLTTDADRRGYLRYRGVIGGRPKGMAISGQWVKAESFPRESQLIRRGMHDPDTGMRPNRAVRIAEGQTLIGYLARCLVEGRPRFAITGENPGVPGAQ
jgi:hypothetical protein